MDLDEFNANERALLHAFYEHWLKQSKKNPTLYPREMEMGEWNEQFLSFAEISKASKVSSKTGGAK